MTRLLLLTLALAGCGPVITSDPLAADCCEPPDEWDEPDSGCDWVPVRYTVTPALAKSFASDAKACRDKGLEPYHQ